MLSIKDQNIILIVRIFQDKSCFILKKAVLTLTVTYIVQKSLKRTRDIHHLVLYSETIYIV